MSAGSAAIPRQARRPGAKRPWTTFLVGFLLCVLLLLPSGCQAQAKSGGGSPEASANPLAKLKPLIKPSVPTGQLQEVAAPLAVQQIQAALADRQPRISIQSPSDGADLPSGNWNLRIQVSDWPLSEAGSMGPGPHVVVQVDGQTPIQITSTNLPGAKPAIQISLPPLSPGSHRITAYAAMPWGEVVRSPGAASQIRVQRVAANPLTLPKKGSPQLLLASPPAEIGAEPVLLDWLLLDAPLQRLRDNDGSWRLKVNLNGDSFVTDKDSPIWLKGWKTGSNSLQLDLLDGRGNPLNSPFNSLVSEVILKSSGPKPRWQQQPLSPAELAVLIGQEPAPKPETIKAKPIEEKVSQPEAAAKEASPEAPKETPLSENLPSEDLPSDDLPSEDPPKEGPSNKNEVVEAPESEETGPQDPEVNIEEPEEIGEQPGEQEEQAAEIDGQTEEPNGQYEETNIQAEDTNSLSQNETGELETSIQTPEPQEPAPDEPTPIESQALESPEPEAIGEAPSIEQPAPKEISNPERLAPSTTLAGSARQQVSEDGSLIKPKRSGPFAGLRERFGAGNPN
ncbi:hypothetical protein [Cyanobium sp. WAJ14-Wanaka]|uniref:hypothetical protein n=1 Tax=Cyanobium sp. WAJ14-Wanaka TaxID=2823725 RepID=UPI0020CC86B7|nr:hypothetical protein [Cyanobium sp. WAJ14-Wanaka]MCP9776068.1 hypothetical protein [Cyanobium sp. WAJ14-Wanaka]